MLYEYLIDNYDAAEPIFFSDIEINHISKSALSQQLKKLCTEGKVVKYDDGIYYLPKKSRLNGMVGINADMVARYKYISRKGKVDGFYSGNAFANQIGISTQVPNQVEIVSNNIAASIREISIGKRKFIVRRSNVPITESNVHVLQMLDLLKNLDAYIDTDYIYAREKFEIFIEMHNITKEDVDKYIREYPAHIFRYYYELGLENVFTQRR